jgi:hypothetical protein
MLSSVVTHATRSKVAPAALLELGKACELFEAAAKICPNSRAGKFVPILHRLSKKAVQVFEAARDGILPSVIPNNIFEPSKPDAHNDELSIFSGKTHTLTTKAKPPRSSSMQSVASPSSGRSSSQSPPHQSFTDNPSFAGVHPSLVDELNVFDGHINAQIQNGYYPNGVYSQPMIVAQHDQEQYRLQGQAQYEQQVREHEEYRRQHAEELRFRQQQRQQQAAQHQSEYSYQSPPHTYDQYARSDSMPGSVPITPVESTPLQHPLIHSSSHRSMRQAYHQHLPQQIPQSHSQGSVHHTPQAVPRSLSHSRSRRSARPAYDPQLPDERPHQEQYGVQGYSQHAAQIHSPTENGSSSSSQVSTPEAMYMDESPSRSPYQTVNPHYWPNGYSQVDQAPTPTHHGIEMHDPRQQHRIQLDQHQQQLRHINLQLGQPQLDHYTPDGALRGIAAEDPRLQEHWQTYMSKVTFLARFLEDERLTTTCF